MIVERAYNDFQDLLIKSTSSSASTSTEQQHENKCALLEGHHENQFELMQNSSFEQPLEEQNKENEKEREEEEQLELWRQREKFEVQEEEEECHFARHSSEELLKSSEKNISLRIQQQEEQNKDLHAEFSVDNIMCDTEETSAELLNNKFHEHDAVYSKSANKNSDSTDYNEESVVIMCKNNQTLEKKAEGNEVTSNLQQLQNQIKESKPYSNNHNSDNSLREYWDHKVIQLFRNAEDKQWTEEVNFCNEKCQNVFNTNEKQSKNNKESIQQHDTSQYSEEQRKHNKKDKYYCSDSNDAIKQDTGMLITCNNEETNKSYLQYDAHENIYERGLRALRNTEQKCKLLKMKLESSKNSRFTFKPIINKYIWHNSNKRHNNYIINKTENNASVQGKKTTNVVKDSIHNTDKTLRWRKRMQILYMPVTNNFKYSPHISSKSHEIICTQRAGNKEELLPAHERLHNYFTMRKQTHSAQNDISGMESQKKCKRTMKQIQEHIESLYAYERTRRSSILRLQTLSNIINNNNQFIDLHNTRNNIKLKENTNLATRKTTISLAKITPLSSPSLYVNTDEVTKRLYHPAKHNEHSMPIGEEEKYVHSIQQIKFSSYKSCKCEAKEKNNKDHDKESSKCLSTENVKHTIEHELHRAKLAKRSQIRHLLQWFMYFAEDNIVNVTKLREYSGNNKHAALLLLKFFEEHDPLCGSWSKEKYLSVVEKLNEYSTLSSLIASKSPMVEEKNCYNGVKVEYSNMKKKNELEKEEVTSASEETKKMEYYKNLTSPLSSARINNLQWSEKYELINKSDITNNEEKHNINNIDKLDEMIKNKYTVSPNVTSRLYWKARKTQLTESFHELESRRLKLKHEQRVTESNEKWMQKYRKKIFEAHHTDGADVENKWDDSVHKEINEEPEELSTKVKNRKQIKEETYKESIIEEENNEEETAQHASEQPLNCSSMELNINIVAKQEDEHEAEEKNNDFALMECEEIESNEIYREDVEAKNKLQLHEINRNVITSTNLESAIFKLEEILNNVEKSSASECCPSCDKFNKKNEQTIVQLNKVSNYIDRNDIYNNKEITDGQVLQRKHKLSENKKQINNENTSKKHISKDKCKEHAKTESYIYNNLLLDCATCSDINAVSSALYNKNSRENKAKFRKLGLLYYRRTKVVEATYLTKKKRRVTNIIDGHFVSCKILFAVLPRSIKFSFFFKMIKSQSLN